MKKFFNRKNTTIVIVFSLMLVLNIVMLYLPAFGAYKGSVKSDNSTTTYTIEYKGNDEIKWAYAIKSGNSEMKDSGTSNVKYNATDKKWETQGIVSTTVSKRNSVFAHTYYYGINKTLKVTSALAIVLQVVFAVGYVVCVVLVVLGNKKGGFKRKKSRR